MNHYECLGVEPDAPRSTIRAAYRARARALHPDVTGDAGTDRLVAVNLAWHVLGDPARRRAYDEQSTTRPRRTRNGPFDDDADRGDDARGTDEAPDPGWDTHHETTPGFTRLITATIVVGAVGVVSFLLIAMIEGH